MDKDYLMDILFDLLNESDALDLQDIMLDKNRDCFRITGKDGEQFDVYCRLARKSFKF